jgi:hypothetical protein
MGSAEDLPAGVSLNSKIKIRLSKENKKTKEVKDRNQRPFEFGDFEFP